MRLNSHIHSRTKGAVTVEAAVCSAAVILLFALFFTVSGYCKTYASVKEYLDHKAREISVVRYTLGFDTPGILPGSDFKSANNRQVKNLIICHEGWGEDIRLRGSYTYVSLLGNFRVVMFSMFTKWEGDAVEKAESVWSLPPAKRGRELERIFGGGLPGFFPVLDAFDPVTGHAASIVSIDTTLECYGSKGKLTGVVTDKINELDSFIYGNCDEILITEMDIDSRELIIVIPENKMSEAHGNELSDCCEYAAEKGINVTVKRYQKVEKSN